MSLLQAYLQSSKTRLILSRKPWEKGFSLIELVVVIGVLAVLTAVALPNFLSVNDDAAVRSVQQGLTAYFKECQVLKARGNYSNNLATNPVIPTLADYTFGSGTATPTASQTVANLRGASGTGNVNDCFQTNGNGTLVSYVVAYPNTTTKFPIFNIISAQGEKECFNGNNVVGAKTYDIGCAPGGATNDSGTW